MKNVLFLFLLLSTSVSFSQLDEGVIQYSIDVEAADTSLQARQNAGLLHNSMMKIYFTKGLLRIDYKMGKITDMKMIIDYERNASLSLIENTQGKYAILKKADELEYPEKNDTNSTIKLFKATKKVLGYTCKKAVITNDGVETVYWYTEEIKIDFKGQQFFDKKIPGFPMVFTTIQGGMKMSYQVSNLVEFVEDKQEIFSTIPPSGYQVINQ
ncbi:MAG: DUF4412 domain-containing protein [Fluviicola sp.]|nr:DUF4412 domain-containing protein [Fluviicola sp.]